MVMPASSPRLWDLDFQPLVVDGTIAPHLRGKIGLYAIFDAAQALQLVAYSRDVALSVAQHLVRQPQACYWLKVHCLERPSRSVLEQLQADWLAESGGLPPGHGAQAAAWRDPIDVKPAMTAEEQARYAASDDLERGKLLKVIARRVEAERVQALRSRGVTMELRFNPKLKEQGLLDLKL